MEGWSLMGIGTMKRNPDQDLGWEINERELSSMVMIEVTVKQDTMKMDLRREVEGYELPCLMESGILGGRETMLAIMGLRGHLKKKSRIELD